MMIFHMNNSVNLLILYFINTGLVTRSLISYSYKYSEG